MTKRKFRCIIISERVIKVRKQRPDAELLSKVGEYINENYQPEKNGINFSMALCDEARSVPREPKELKKAAKTYGGAGASPTPVSLIDRLNQTDESFTEMLLRKIDEKNMTDAQCYKKAGIDRKLFSKIRSDRLYRPRKSTVLSFAVALGLSIDETKEMLMKAGYALSHSSKFDIIVEYFIINGIYDLFLINETLYEFDQPLLGV